MRKIAFFYNRNNAGTHRFIILHLALPSLLAASLLVQGAFPTGGLNPGMLTAHADEPSYAVVGGGSDSVSYSLGNASDGTSLNSVEDLSYAVVGGSGGASSSSNQSTTYTAVNGRGEPVDALPLDTGEPAAGVYVDESYDAEASASAASAAPDSSNAGYAVVSANTALAGSASYADVAPAGAIRETGTDFIAGTGREQASEIAAASGIQYTNLRELLIAGNASLRQNSTYSSMEDLRYQIGILEAETGDMTMNRDLYKDSDPQTAAEYDRSASAMSQTLKNLRKRLDRMTSEVSSSLDETIDAMEMSAQTRFASYNQMAVQAGAKEKSLAAAQKKYENTVLRYSAGAATESQVESAQNSLMQQENELESYRQQMTTLRRNLLSMFGLADSTSIVIGAVPEPDLAAIAAIDFASDRQKAIDSDPAVQRVRHQSANSSAAMDLKNQTEAEAVGSAEASILDSYNQLQARLTEYQAALSARASAEQDFGTVQRRRQAGLATEADYLTGEAAWLSAQAAFTSASISLRQAYDSYVWQVQGVG